nr:reverse transcriptase domain-containing protein [Tanacetum cinerariifolium]
MPDPHIHTMKSNGEDDTYYFSMAFLIVKNRHCRSTANSTRRCEVPHHSHRLLNKMGQSKATKIHNWVAYGEICSEYSKPSTQSITPKKIGKLRSPTGTSPKEWSKEWERLTKASIVYGSKAVVLIEISVETKRIRDFDVKQNEKRCREDLDILKERRDISSIREAHYKQI